MSLAAFICRSERLSLRRGGCGAGGLRRAYKQDQDVSTIAKDGPLKSRGTQHGHPGADQRSVSPCTAEKARVFDLWTWPRHRVGTRGRGFERWEAEWEKMAAGRGLTWEWDTALRISASRSWFAHEFLTPTLFWPSLICNFTSPFLESAIATAGGRWGFSLPDLVF